jgi:hypothetical protein
MAPVGQAPVPQINASSFTGFLQSIFSKALNTNTLGQSAVNLAANPLNPYGSQPQQYGPPAPKVTNPNLVQNRGSAFQTVQTSKEPTNAFKSPVSPSNDLVGSAIGPMPTNLDWKTVQQIVPGSSFSDINAAMKLKGYAWDARNGQFVQVTQPTGSAEQLAGSQQSLLRDANGRVFANPYEIGPTLSPGERALTAGHKTEAGTTIGSGVGVTGGTSYTDAQGNTVAQYAVSYGSGGDRWKFKISQDNAGNWVRTYYRTFSKARSRSALKRKQGGTPNSSQNQSGKEENQLVNFRANFG